MRTTCLVLLMVTSPCLAGNLGQSLSRVFSPDNILQSVARKLQPRERQRYSDSLGGSSTEEFYPGAKRDLQAQSVDEAVFNHVRAQDAEIAEMRAEIARLRTFCIQAKKAIVELQREKRNGISSNQ